MLTHDTTWDPLLSNLLEDHALQHMELIQAGPMRDGTAGGLMLHSQLLGWDSLQSTLKAIGFDLNAPDHWSKLGLGKEFGPEPALQLILQRLAFAKLLLQAADSTGWEASDKQAAAQARQVFQKAADYCSGELNATIRNRQKMKPQETPRWGEVERSNGNGAMGVMVQ